MTSIKTTALAIAMALTAGTAFAADSMSSGGMKMSAADSKMMKSCMAMTEAKMMKNAGCVKMMKAHPDMMKHDSMMKNDSMMKHDSMMKTDGAMGK